jgi:MFS family permease
MSDTLQAELTGRATVVGDSTTVSVWDKSQRRSLDICIFVACTGFFHGYDNGVVNGVFEMAPFRDHMGWPPTIMDCAIMNCTVTVEGENIRLQTGDINPYSQTSTVALHEGMTVNGFNAAAAVSALLFGTFLVDQKGRRPALIIGSALFALGGTVQAASIDAFTLIVGRVIAGIGVGMTSSAGTAYIAEVSPAVSRGAMIGIYQNNICIAIVLAALLNYADKEWSNGWRISLGMQLLMGLAVTLGLWFVPETPRFLAKAGQIEAAKEVMLQLRGDEAAAQAELDGVLADIAAEQAAGQASWREILVVNPTFRNVVLIGCGVQFAQIITGINALVSFSGTMFRQLGVSGLNAAVLPFVAFLIGSEFTSFILLRTVGILRCLQFNPNICVLVRG